VVLEKSGTGAVRRKGLANPVVGGSGLPARQRRAGAEFAKQPQHVERRKARRVMSTPGVEVSRIRHAKSCNVNDTVRRPALHSPHLRGGKRNAGAPAP